MKTVGLVVAVELAALKRRYGEPLETRIVCSQRILHYRTERFALYVIRSGAGEIAAAAATQLLLCAYHVDVIVNFGVVGALTEEASTHRLCAVKSVVHYQFDTSQADGAAVGRYFELPDIHIPTDETLLRAAMERVPDLRAVVCASGDQFIGGSEERTALHERFGADICEMEAAGIALTAYRCGVPCLLIKMVSDGLHGGAEEFFQEFRRASDLCLAALEQAMEAI